MRMQNDEELQDAYYNSLTPEDLGSAWWNKCLNDLPTNVSLSVGSRYTTSPRPYDSENTQRRRGWDLNSCLCLYVDRSVRNRYVDSLWQGLCGEVDFYFISIFLGSSSSFE